MTKPANFPGRVNARRQAALGRLGKSRKTKLTKEQIAAEAANITAKLNPDAGGVRTKKVRGQGRGR